MSDNRHLERIFADPPTESDLLGHPIDGNGEHPVWRAIRWATLAACAAAALGIVAYVAFVLGVL
ncbi:MAG: hypothetical protein OXI55_10125 [Gammaproteobacteria bacterium]|nr:hypothetical protein [Gammaproteobacteria bacterium]